MQPLTDEQRDIVEKNIPWVIKRAAARHKSMVDMDTLIQEGIIGLSRAVQLHDPSISTLSTYARFHIDAKMIIAEEKAQKKRRLPKSLRLRPVVIEEQEPDYDAERIATAVSHLPERERRIINEHYWLGRSHGEIASDMGVTKSRVWQLEKRAKDKLQKMINP